MSTPVSAQKMSKKARTRCVEELRSLLTDIGHPERWRAFRMCLTVCYHKVALPDEVDAAFGLRRPHGHNLAGGPVEILAESEPAPTSAKPCENPSFRDVFAMPIPQDCGKCKPCEARATYHKRATCPACKSRKHA